MMGLFERQLQRRGWVRASSVPEIERAFNKLAEKAGTLAFDPHRTDGWVIPVSDGQKPEDAYATNPILYAAVKRVADAAAQIPLQVGREIDGEFDPLDDHEALRLFNRPNEYQTGDAFRRALYSWHVLRGESFVFLDFEDRELAQQYNPAPNRAPRQLHLIHPANIEAKAHPTKRVGHYVLTVGAKQYKIDASRIIHVTEFTSRDTLGGIGSGEVLSATLALDDYATRYQESGFKGGSHNRLLITFKSFVNNLEDVMRQFGRKYMGVGKTRKPIGIDNGAEVTEIGQSNADLEYGELRKFNRELITATCGVPPSMVGLLEHANYSNMEVQERIFWEQQIRPMLKLYEGFWTRFLLPLFGSREMVARYDLSGVAVLQEAISDWVDLATAIAAVPGLADTDQLRRIITEKSLDALADEPDPDKVLVPFSLQTMSDLTTDFSDLMGESGGDTEDASPPPSDSPPSERAPRDPIVEKALREAIKSNVKNRNRRLQSRLEARFMRDVTTPLLRQWQDAINAQIRTNDQKGVKVYTVADVDGILTVLDRVDAQNVAEEKARAFHAKAVDFRSRDVLRQLQSAGAVVDEIDLAAPYIQLYLQQKPMTFAGNWPDTVIKKLRGRLLDELNGQSLGISELQNVVADVMKVERKRALLVARTEATAAFEFASDAAYNESGVVESREWLPNTERHADVPLTNGPKPLGEPFDVHGSRMMFPGDPSGPVSEIANCGCSTAPVVAPAERNANDAKREAPHQAADRGTEAHDPARGRPVG